MASVIELDDPYNFDDSDVPAKRLRIVAYDHTGRDLYTGITRPEHDYTHGAANPKLVADILKGLRA